MEKRISIAPTYQICVDAVVRGDLTGRLYCGCWKTGKPFHGTEGLLMALDRIMDEVGFPQSTVNKRIFDSKKTQPQDFNKKEREVLVAMRTFDGSKNKGEKATFILEVQFRQNASWQGVVEWVEKGERIPFDSALELIKIIDRAVESGYQVDVKGDSAPEILGE